MSQTKEMTLLGFDELTVESKVKVRDVLGVTEVAVRDTPRRRRHRAANHVRLQRRLRVGDWRAKVVSGEDARKLGIVTVDDDVAVYHTGHKLHGFSVWIAISTEGAEVYLSGNRVARYDALDEAMRWCGRPAFLDNLARLRVRMNAKNKGPTATGRLKA